MTLKSLADLVENHDAFLAIAATTNCTDWLPSEGIADLDVFDRGFTGRIRFHFHGRNGDDRPLAGTHIFGTAIVSRRHDGSPNVAIVTISKQ